MKILLVQSWLGRAQHPVMPLGLASIAASLASHEVRIEDLNLSISPMERLRSVLTDFKPEAIGFSLRNADTTSYCDRYSYIPQFLQQIELASLLCPEAYILAGGAGFSIFPDQIMGSSPLIQCGVIGHGELIIEDLLRHRATGLHRGKAGGFVLPRYDLVEVNRYIPFESNLSMGVEVNRGCNLGCRYCSYSAISGKSVKERALELIETDIEQLLGFHASHLFLIAPILNSSRERGIKVAEMIRALNSGVSWEAYHSPVGFDREYAELIRNSGCSAVSFSPDAGTSRQMKNMGKDYDVSDLESAIKSAVFSGIEVSLNIFPWDIGGGLREMVSSFRNGSEWGRMAGEKLRRLRFGLIRRLPGTQFAPGEISLNSGIPAREFATPSPLGMIAFRALKKMYERNV